MTKILIEDLKISGSTICKGVYLKNIKDAGDYYYVPNSILFSNMPKHIFIDYIPEKYEKKKREPKCKG